MLGNARKGTLTHAVLYTVDMMEIEPDQQSHANDSAAKDPAAKRAQASTPLTANNSASAASDLMAIEAADGSTLAFSLEDPRYNCLSTGTAVAVEA